MIMKYIVSLICTLLVVAIVIGFFYMLGAHPRLMGMIGIVMFSILISSCFLYLIILMFKGFLGLFKHL